MHKAKAKKRKAGTPVVKIGGKQIDQRDLLLLVDNAPGDRLIRNMSRRGHKLGEETGEWHQAYLQVSSRANPKRKTWDHVREEAVDAMIVSADLALTRTPLDRQRGLTQAEIREAVAKLVVKKLRKWIRKGKGRREVTLDPGTVGWERKSRRRRGAARRK